MPDTSNLFNSSKPYATAADYEDVAQQTQIHSAGVDSYDGEEFAWVKLDCIEKPIRLNKTNGRGLAEKFGPDTDQWLNQEVFVTTANGTFDDGRKWTGWRISPIKKQ